MDPGIRRIIDERLAKGQIDFEEHRRLVEELEKPVATPSAGGFAVVLQAQAPGSKIETIKAVREATGVGLKAAKFLVEAAPVVLVEGVDRSAAEAIARNLLDLGARAEAVPADSRSLELPRGAAAKARAQAASGCLILAALLLAGVLPAVAAALAR